MTEDPRLDPVQAERVLAEIHEGEVLGFLRALVRIPTVNPPGDVREAAEFCRQLLAREGFETEFETVEATKPNLIAWLRAGDGPTVLFNSHLDVVPIGEEASWTHPPFAGEIVNGRVYGRGANDDKASVTAQVLGAIALKRSGVQLRGTLIVNEVADEEVGGRLGAALIAERADIRPDAVIVGEPTRNRICVGERGGVGIRVVVFGRTAHGALPWEGVNAIEGMARVISALERDLWPRLTRKTHPYFAHASATISLIEGGVKTNVVPDRCSIFIDRRLIPGETPEEAIAEVREVAEQAVAVVPGLRVEVGPAHEWGGRPAVMSPPDSLVVQAMREVNRFLGLESDLTGFSMGTDGRFFAAKGYPTIIYGPGDPSLAHKPDEWVGIDEVMAATRAYALAALLLLGATS